MATAVLEVRDLVKHYTLGGGMFGAARKVQAVDGVSFELMPGETLSIVGESGCGKSTLARCILRLVEPTGGAIRLADTDIARLPEHALRPFRRSIQIVFQDPFASLDPRQRVIDAVATPLRLHGMAAPGDIADRARRLLRDVGLGDEVAIRHPHELSGGQRQRVAIARALAVEPRVVILDEPVSALDMSIQAQVINLLMELQDRLGVSYVLISHNLPLVEHVSDRIAIMYLGRFVEIADHAVLARRALHPYTQALFAAAPSLDVAAARTETRALLT
ncbi:MAG: ATP-binding cassette domain-containing protein, partial [Alphaproteobacteria bacterium]|nr:ATP-binding cassette domain-containing protein [Alphaproteobacteria bacterium]